MHFQVEALLLAATLTAALTDARTGKIPNWLTFPLIGLGFVGHFAESGARGLLGAFIGLVLCASVPLLLRAASKDAMGGGDLKLFAGLGAIGGPLLGMQIQLASYVVLAVYALFVLAYRGRLTPVLANAFWLAAARFHPASRRRTVAPEALTQMRMGAAIFAACVVATAARHFGVSP